MKLLSKILILWSLSFSIQSAMASDCLTIDEELYCKVSTGYNCVSNNISIDNNYYCKISSNNVSNNAFQSEGILLLEKINNRGYQDGNTFGTWLCKHFISCNH